MNKMLSYSPQDQSRDFRVVERAIRFILENHEEQPELEAIAGAAGLSMFHFQRVFSRWAGISPKKFLQFITIEHAKEVLRTREQSEKRSVLEAAYEVGLSSQSRLYDLFVNFEAMTPGEYKSLGRDITILYSYFEGPFGRYLLATTERGICALRFLSPGGEGPVLDELKAEWPLSSFKHDPVKIRNLAAVVFGENAGGKPFSLHVKGTNFQVKVWEALLRIPPGILSTYGRIAEELGNPRATRAVGSAVGKNPVSYIIPCHRVIRSSGVLGNYRWGKPRKLGMIGYEAAGINLR